MVITVADTLWQIKRMLSAQKTLEEYSTKAVAINPCKFDTAAQNKDKDLPSATSSSIAPFTCEKHHWILPSPSPSPIRTHAHEQNSLKTQLHRR